MEPIKLKLTRGLEALIDADDAHLADHKWTACAGFGTFYARRQDCNGRTVQLHRAVLAYDGPLDVHHINGNGLDNRKTNLAVVSRSLNHLNKISSSNLYVRKAADGSLRYDARIALHFVQYNLGTFRSKWAAALIIRINKDRINNNMPIVIIKRDGRWKPLKRRYIDWRVQDGNK